MRFLAPSLVDHLRLLITDARKQGYGPLGVVLPIWLKRQLFDEIRAMATTYTDPALLQDLDAEGDLRFCGVEVSFHDRLGTVIIAGKH